MFEAEAMATLAEISAIWNRTEEIIKVAERLRGEVVQPSINELRYAGRRIVDALTIGADDAPSAQKIKEYISDAKFRCYCAQHDALDAAVLFVHRVIREYEAEFGIARVHTHFPWVADLKAMVLSADDMIVSSRADRGRRQDLYDKMGRELLTPIVDGYRKLASNREALARLIHAQPEKVLADIA